MFSNNGKITDDSLDTPIFMQGPNSTDGILNRSRSGTIDGQLW